MQFFILLIFLHIFMLNRIFSYKVNTSFIMQPATSLLLNNISRETVHLIRIERLNDA